MTPSDAVRAHIDQARAILESARDRAASDAKSFVILTPDYETVKTALTHASDILDAEDRALEQGIDRLADETLA